MIFLLNAAWPKLPQKKVAMVAPRTPVARPMRIAMIMPNCGGPHSIMTIMQEPTIIPVAERGNFRAMVRSSMTRRATRGIKIAAKRMQNAKSKMYPKPVLNIEAADDDANGSYNKRPPNGATARFADQDGSLPTGGSTNHGICATEIACQNEAKSPVQAMKSAELSNRRWP